MLLGKHFNNCMDGIFGCRLWTTALSLNNRTGRSRRLYGHVFYFSGYKIAYYVSRQLVLVSICISELQTASGVSSFSDVKSAVDAVVEILQSGIPMARIGKLTLNP